MAPPHRTAHAFHRTPMTREEVLGGAIRHLRFVTHRWMHPTVAIVAAGTIFGCAMRDLENLQARDLREARHALERNIQALHDQDAESYLALYDDSPSLIVASADSVSRGFGPFAEARRSSLDWPDTLIVSEPTMEWIAPGVVWAAFPYTAVVQGDSARGVAERLFVKTRDGWRIRVTGVMEQ